MKKREQMNNFFYSIGITAAIVTLYMGIENGLMGLALFAISPYLGLLYILKIAKHPTAIIIAKTVTVFLVSVGLYFLLDTTYMERRLETKFSFLFIPIWQWTMLLVSGFVIYLSNENKISEE